VDTIAVGDGPTGIAFIGGYIWVANNGSSTLSQIDPRPGKVLNTFAVGKSPSSVTYDGLNFWVANSGSNSVSRLAL
jgi:YVTN family beta-propeller protein